MKALVCVFLVLVMPIGLAQRVDDVRDPDTEIIDVRLFEDADVSDFEGVRETEQERIDRQTYEAARSTNHWCLSDSLWEERRAELGIQNLMSGCPTEGVCDTPSVRDATSTSNKSIRIYVHLMRNSNGSGGPNLSGVQAAYARLRSDYAGTGITFTVVGARWVNNSAYATIPAYSPFNSAWFTAISNMKSQYAISPGNTCNIFVSAQQSSSFGTLLGIATFPWDPNALTSQGGLWLNNVTMTGSSHTWAHELGHCFGLWHTHHGVSEVASCSNCYEYASGLQGDTRGDFCSDTPPTPTNYTCSPPGGSDCQGTSWGSTQVANYMGYSPDVCQSLFTAQQRRRMHCWVNDSIPAWIQ